MKKILFLIVTLSVFSCEKKAEKTTLVKTDSIEKSNVETPKVGGDEDTHGCKSSAGYAWSELRSECVRLFDSATRLNPYEQKSDDSATLSAFVIFDGDRAELFLPTENSMILTRKSEGDSFVNGDWMLIPWKGYVLKKDGKIMYTGQ